MTTDTLECPKNSRHARAYVDWRWDGQSQVLCGECHAMMIGNRGEDIYGRDSLTIDFQVTSLEDADHARTLGQLAIQLVTPVKGDEYPLSYRDVQSRQPMWSMLELSHSTGALVATVAARYARRALNH